MKNKFRIACRGSELSLAQVKIFIKKVNGLYPDVEFEIIKIKTRGDKLVDTPLDLIEGKDFFTNDVQYRLFSGEADFAVHSMKDVSHLSFFDQSKIAVMERGVPHDIAIFNKNINDIIDKGQEIRLGTSSPRRSIYGVEFLKKALPSSGRSLKLKAVPIRGNVDTRLKKLDREEYDGIILALEGINRLIEHSNLGKELQKLLSQKRTMLLPIFKCPPAANQAMLIAEAPSYNHDACKIIESINEPHIEARAKRERKIVDEYGHEGCSQLFGVVSDGIMDFEFDYAYGKTKDGRNIHFWNFPEPDDLLSDVLTFRDINDEAFTYSALDNVKTSDLRSTVIFTHGRSIPNNLNVLDINSKSIWATGVKTWQQLASKGIWVDGCSDGLGLRYLNKLWGRSFFNHTLNGSTIFTNDRSIKRYGLNFDARANYGITPTYDEKIIHRLKSVKAVFWSSFIQFLHYHSFTRDDTIHMCSAGKTANLIKNAGFDPVIFPTIQSFKSWENTRSVLEG